MFQSSSANILPISNRPITQDSESTSYNWQKWVKAGLVFATTAGAFLALKTTGSFGLISTWLRNSKTDVLMKIDENPIIENTMGYIEPLAKSANSNLAEFTEYNQKPNVLIDSISWGGRLVKEKTQQVLNKISFGNTCLHGLALATASGFLNHEINPAVLGLSAIMCANRVKADNLFP